MSKKKMLVVSVLATCCLSILAVVTIILLAQFEYNDVKQAADLVETKAESIEIETTDDEHPFSAQGIEQYTDQYGLHDIYYSNEDKIYEGESGPIEIKITKVQLERFYPKENIGKVFAEGRDEVSIVAINLEVVNSGNEEAYFEVKSIRGKADNGESSQIETLLSDTFTSVYAAGSKQQGTLYFMYTGNPNNIATVTMQFNAAESAKFEKMGDSIKLKVDLY